MGTWAVSRCLGDAPTQSPRDELVELQAKIGARSIRRAVIGTIDVSTEGAFERIGEYLNAGALRVVVSGSEEELLDMLETTKYPPERMTVQVNAGANDLDERVQGFIKASKFAGILIPVRSTREHSHLVRIRSIAEKMKEAGYDFEMTLSAVDWDYRADPEVGGTADGCAILERLVGEFNAFVSKDRGIDLELAHVTTSADSSGVSASRAFIACCRTDRDEDCTPPLCAICSE